jgi:hypothetical protein
MSDYIDGNLWLLEPFCESWEGQLRPANTGFAGARFLTIPKAGRQLPNVPLVIRMTAGALGFCAILQEQRVEQQMLGC